MELQRLRKSSESRERNNAAGPGWMLRPVPRVLARHVAHKRRGLLWASGRGPRILPPAQCYLLSRYLLIPLPGSVE